MREVVNFLLDNWLQIIIGVSLVSAIVLQVTGRIRVGESGLFEASEKWKQK